MISTLVKKIIGSKNDRTIKSYSKTVKEINKLEEYYSSMTDDDLASQTSILKEEHLNHISSKAEILIKSFAIIRETSQRTLKMRHFDTQLIGGLVLNDGKIAEMGTGEGKTLVATLPCYYNAIIGNRVHIVTVNDYLAKRDSDEMSVLFSFLGLTTSCNTSDLKGTEKVEAYKADIIYGTNSEFGFDYLRDNLVKSKDDKIQGALQFCLIDEVDSILIDEARTPLIISGPVEDSVDMYLAIKEIVDELTNDNVVITEKDKSAQLNEAGFSKIEDKLITAELINNKEDLYSVSGLTVMHYINASLKAKFVIKRDVDYLVRDGEILIIDEFTGRAMDGRRWSQGLHQALEAKEGVKIYPENETVASITYQNFFRMYSALSGMTGTADTEAPEFLDIYGLDVVCVPPNKKLQRIDDNDQMYVRKEYKYKAITADVISTHKTGQPILIGTPSVEVSEEICGILMNNKLKFNVLNAKNHDKEAHIIAEAGSIGSITVATNMAGRGTDIKLGGTDLVHRNEVLSLGGLRVIGVERQDNRRLDNQLRGRSGRQGDPGSSCFYVSPEDTLMRIFGGDRIKSMMEKFGATDEVIEHSFLNSAVTNSQKKVEGHNYDARKSIIKYDDVANQQRVHVYEIRDKVLLLENENMDEYLMSFFNNIIDTIISESNPGGVYLDEESDQDIFMEEVGKKLGFATAYSEDFSADMVLEFKSILDTMNEFANEEIFAYKREVMLSMVDREWISHINRTEEIKRSVGLRGYAQKDPIKEFQSESFESFSHMIFGFQLRTIKNIVESYIYNIEKIQEMIDKEDNKE